MFEVVSTKYINKYSIKSRYLDEKVKFSVEKQEMCVLCMEICTRIIHQTRGNYRSRYQN